MLPITKDELNALTAHQTAERIDQFFLEALLSRHPEVTAEMVDGIIGTTAMSIVQSKTFTELNDNDRKRAIGIFYRAKFQNSLYMQLSDFTSRLLPHPNQTSLWANAAIQVTHAASRQSQIIGSRIGFECLMEFVYFVENKKIINAKKSKQQKFRTFLLNPGNRFGWLIFYMLTCHKFDTALRTPEIHGQSQIAIDALLCISRPEKFAEVDGINALLNVWQSVLSTLNGIDPTNYAAAFWNSEIFQKYFFRWREIDLQDLWKREAGNS